MAVPAWLMNRFGDAVFVVNDGPVHRLDVALGEFERLADDREAFLTRLDDDKFANDVLMINLVDRLPRSARKLKPGWCHGFRSPVILGGKYEADNIVPMPIVEHWEFHALLHRKLRDQPDGTRVKLVPKP